MILRPLVSLLALVGLWIWLDPAAVLAEVGRLDPAWLLLGLALTLPQIALSAWRWRLTSRLLGLPLGWARALREYYLAMFLNQVLPGGVAGDAARAWRHSRASGRQGSAWRAVIIERASGQLAVVLLSLLVFGVSPLWHGVFGEVLARLFAPRWWLAGSAFLLALALLVVRLYRHPPAALAGLGHDLHRSLLSSSAWPRQLGGSLLVVISYALVFVCAARAIGVTLPVATLLALVPPVLLAMLIPLSVAGWGIREGAAALVWGLAGLPPAQGVAVSMAYGLLVLLASLPGLLWLPGLRHRRESPVDTGPFGSGSGQVEIEEGVVSATEGSRARTAGLVQGGDGRHGQSRTPGSDQQRGNEQVQTMEHPGFQESGHRYTTALDQYAVMPQFSQCIEYPSGRETTVLHRQSYPCHMLGDVLLERDRFADQMKRRGPRIARQRLTKQLQRRGNATPRVDDYPGRLAPLHMAHGQQGIVLARRAGADHHGIHQGAKTVQMNAALQPVDIVGMTALGGDSPVQALPELGERQASGLHHQGRKAIEQITGLIIDWHICLPAGCVQAQSAKSQERGVGTITDIPQRLPGSIGIQASHHRNSISLGVMDRHRASGAKVSRHHAQSAMTAQGIQGDHNASG